MATPKNEKEWAIYHEMVEEAKKDPVIGKANLKVIETFKNNQSTTESWETFKCLMETYG